jgi:hypothetical protein
LIHDPERASALPAIRWDLLLFTLSRTLMEKIPTPGQASICPICLSGFAGVPHKGSLKVTAFAR